MGDLQNHIDSAPPLPELEACEIISQVLEAVNHMHDNDFAHRDLKLAVSETFALSSNPTDSLDCRIF